MQDFNLDNIDDLLESDNKESEVIEDEKDTRKGDNAFVFGNVVNDKPEPKKVENKSTPKSVASANQKTSAPVEVKKDANYLLVENVLSKITQSLTLTAEKFTDKDKAVASDIVLMTAKAVKTNGYSWNQIDLVSNNYIGDIKRWAKLGIDSNDHLYPDIRRNSKTGMVDLKIKPQYQTIEKLIIKYCSKKVVSFRTDVICVGDDFETDFDFENGVEKVVKHTKSPDRNPNSLDDITGAYKIAYYEEPNGKRTQILCVIDKNRIMRAYNAAQTKNVWNADTLKMVKKTVTWEMWNSEVIRPFMNFPTDILEDLSIVDENSDVDFTSKERKYKDVESATDNAKRNINSGDVIDVEL